MGYINIEKTIDDAIKKDGKSFIINGKFLRLAIIQSKNLTDCVLASKDKNVFTYKGAVFKVIDDGDCEPKIRSERNDTIRK